MQYFVIVRVQIFRFLLVILVYDRVSDQNSHSFFKMLSAVSFSMSNLTEKLLFYQYIYFFISVRVFINSIYIYIFLIRHYCTYISMYEKIKGNSFECGLKVILSKVHFFVNFVRNIHQIISFCK